MKFLSLNFDPLKYKHEGWEFVTLNNKHSGGRQGYVKIPASHPLYLLQYYDKCPMPKSKIEIDSEFGNITKIDQLIEKYGIFKVMTHVIGNPEASYDSIDSCFSVHGGITYSGPSYWNKIEIDIDNVVNKKEMLYYIKVANLVNNLGNDNFLFWLKKSSENDKFIPHKEHQSKRYYKFKNVLEELSKEKLIYLANNVKYSYNNYAYDSETNQLIAYNNDWWFGWDCAHYNDTRKEFTEERAIDECKKLIGQFADWTIKYFNQ